MDDRRDIGEVGTTHDSRSADEVGRGFLSTWPRSAVLPSPPATLREVGGAADTPPPSDAQLCHHPKLSAATVMADLGTQTEAQCNIDRSRFHSCEGKTTLNR
jgi:hypothetical protein